jgi:hypothetical protein
VAVHLGASIVSVQLMIGVPSAPPSTDKSEANCVRFGGGPWGRTVVLLRSCGPDGAFMDPGQLACDPSGEIRLCNLRVGPPRFVEQIAPIRSPRPQ